MMHNIADKAKIWKHRVGEDAEDAAEATKEFAKGSAEEVKRKSTKEGL